MSVSEILQNNPALPGYKNVLSEKLGISAGPGITVAPTIGTIEIARDFNFGTAANSSDPTYPNAVISLNTGVATNFLEILAFEFPFSIPENDPNVNLLCEISGYIVLSGAPPSAGTYVLETTFTLTDGVTAINFPSRSLAIAAGGAVASFSYSFITPNVWPGNTALELNGVLEQDSGEDFSVNSGDFNVILKISPVIGQMI
jgi:hypothetical protein